MTEFPTITELCDIVRAAARNIERPGWDCVSPETKIDGSYVTVVDKEIQNQLFRILSQKWPQFGFIGEEMEHVDQVRVCRQSERGYWVLDPLDGTTNFAAGFQFYGISLALVIEDNPVLAVVYDPIRDECFSAQKGKGAYLNGEKLFCSGDPRLENCIANIDYKRLVGELAVQLVRAPPYRSQRNLGSAVLEWCWLASGRFHLYLHGGQKLWDFSAGYLILRESGGVATSLSGLPLDCSKLRKRSVVAAISTQLLDQWIDWIYQNSDVQQSSPL